MKYPLNTAMITCLVIWSVSTAHAGGLGGAIAYTTDYRFRGISQTSREFAVQGGLSYAWDSGLYIGTWASNVANFAPNPITGEDGAQTEIDFYGGYSLALSDRWGLGVEAIYYYYPGASDAGNQAEINYMEVAPGVSYDGEFLDAGLSIAFSPDYFAESGTAFYFNSSASIPVADVVSINLHAGYQTIEENSAFGTPDYADWSIALSTTQFGLDWSIAYVDTNLSDDECFNGGDICSATAVASVGYSF